MTKEQFEKALELQKKMQLISAFKTNIDDGIGSSLSTMYNHDIKMSGEGKGIRDIRLNPPRDLTTVTRIVEEEIQEMLSKVSIKLESILENLDKEFKDIKVS